MPIKYRTNKPGEGPAVWHDLADDETPPAAAWLFQVIDAAGNLRGEVASAKFARMLAKSVGPLCLHCRSATTPKDIEAGRAHLAGLGVTDPAEFPACESCAYSRGRNYCTCGSGQWADAEYDGHGIYLCKCCDKCRAEKLGGFRDDIKEAYETDEPIEADY